MADFDELPANLSADRALKQESDLNKRLSALEKHIGRPSATELSDTLRRLVDDFSDGVNRAIKKFEET